MLGFNFGRFSSSSIMTIFDLIILTISFTVSNSQTLEIGHVLLLENGLTEIEKECIDRFYDSYLRKSQYTLKSVSSYGQKHSNQRLHPTNSSRGHFKQ